MKLDPFTLRRIGKFIQEHRTGSGQLPTHRDLEAAGFPSEVIAAAVRQGALEELYVTLTNGSIVKGYKVVDRSGV